jgi:hypothetical protein
LESISNKSTKRKKILAEIFDGLLTSDVQVRYLIVEILEQIALKCPKEMLSEIVHGLKTIYNEPNKDLEKRFIEIYVKLVTEYSKDIPLNKLKIFFESILIKQEVYQNITKSRIHNLNVKIFINNFEVQEILVNLYLHEILKNKTDTTQFAELLEDYNAIIIAFTLLQKFDVKSRKKILARKSLKNIHNEAFLETINNILNLYNEGNIKELSEIFDPKLGINFSNKIKHL